MVMMVSCLGLVRSSGRAPTLGLRNFSHSSLRNFLKSARGEDRAWTQVKVRAITSAFVLKSKLFVTVWISDEASCQTGTDADTALQPRCRELGQLPVKQDSRCQRHDRDAVCLLCLSVTPARVVGVLDLSSGDGDGGGASPER